MIPLAAKLIMSALLSALAVFLYFYLKGDYRRECMIAMLLSSCGDAFMVDNFIKIGDFGTYIGAAFFIAAHIIYGKCFYKMSKDKGYAVKGAGLYTGIAVMAASAIALAVLALVVPENPQPIMLCLIMIYVAVIGYHLVCNFSYSFSAKRLNYVLAFAVLIFYVSDLFIFFDMLNITHALRDYVWFVYPVAQLLLILFNSPLKKES